MPTMTHKTSPATPAQLCEGEHRIVTVSPACNVRDLYDLLGRFIRLGWGAAPLMMNGEKIDVRHVGIGCDFHNEIYFNMEAGQR